MTILSSCQHRARLFCMCCPGNRRAGGRDLGVPATCQPFVWCHLESVTCLSEPPPLYYRITPYSFWEDGVGRSPLLQPCQAPPSHQGRRVGGSGVRASALLGSTVQREDRREATTQTDTPSWDRGQGGAQVCQGHLAGSRACLHRACPSHLEWEVSASMAGAIREKLLLSKYPLVFQYYWCWKK